MIMETNYILQLIRLRFSYLSHFQSISGLFKLQLIATPIIYFYAFHNWFTITLYAQY